MQAGRPYEVSPIVSTAKNRVSLFLSHASEDKAPFVNALAAKLEGEYDLWFDEYSLKVGDSIFESVSRGLRACDYGIVVLSPNFFLKKWTRAELDGLFALERVMHKIILPVWLGVSQEDVLNFSPILADRKAALASDGVESVVSGLNLAISTSREVRVQEAGGSTVSRAAQLSHDKAERDRSAQMLQQPDGINLVREQSKLLFDTAEVATVRLIEASPALALSYKRDNTHGGVAFLNIYGSNDLLERFDYLPKYTNTAGNDELGIHLCRYSESHREQNEPATKINNRNFIPFITLADQVLWKDAKGLHDSTEVIELAHAEFVEQIGKEQRG